MPEETPMTRAFDQIAKPFDDWMEGEVALKSRSEEVVNAWVSYSALMAANILRSNVDGRVLYETVATCSIRFLDSLRIALARESNDAWKKDDGLGRGNGNGASS